MKKSVRVAAAALSVAAFSAIGALEPACGGESPRRYLCPSIAETASPPTIDGHRDAVWDTAPWSAPFVDIRSASHPAPLFATRFRALWDAEALYVFAELEEPRLFATLTEHDSVIFHDPDFELFLDPEGDSREYFELEVNALGTTWDLQLDRPYHQGGRADDAWELAGLEVGIELRGTLDDPRDIDSGWAVELKLPWRAFASAMREGRAPVPGESWRINFSRVEWPLVVVDGRYERVPDACEENWVWSPQGRIDMHRPERWGYLEFAR